MPKVTCYMLLVVVLAVEKCTGPTQTAAVTANSAGIAGENDGHSHTAGVTPSASSQLEQPGIFIVSLASAQDVAEVIFPSRNPPLQFQNAYVYFQPTSGPGWTSLYRKITMYSDLEGAATFLLG